MDIDDNERQRIIMDLTLFYFDVVLQQVFPQLQGQPAAALQQFAQQLDRPQLNAIIAEARRRAIEEFRADFDLFVQRRSANRQGKGGGFTKRRRY